MSRDQFEGEDRRAPERWRVKKEISIGDLIAFGCAMCSVVYAYSTLSTRLTLVEVAQTNQVKVDNRQDEESVRNQARIDTQLSAINAKLDRLIENRR